MLKNSDGTPVIWYYYRYDKLDNKWVLTDENHEGAEHLGGGNANNTREENRLWANQLISDFNNSEKFLTIHCSDCNETFLISMEEKEWFITNNFSIPKRCRTCRAKRKRKRGN